MFTVAYSQKYQPVDSTTAWSSEYGYKYSSSTCYLLENQKYYIKGYVVDLGRVWHKVYTTRVTQVHPSSFCSSTPSLPSPIYNSLRGYLYNDIANKKIYILSSAPSNYTLSPNDVWYDFNKTVGDSLYFRHPSYTPFPYKFKINSVDSILFSGKYHKRFLTTCVPSAINVPNPVSFIEGIGSSFGPFDALINPMGEQFTNLICFSSPTHTMAVTNHTAYTTSTFCNNIVLGMQESTNNDFIFYPNPASNTISFHNVKPGTNYQIHSPSGVLVQEGVLENKLSISIDLVADGIYFISLSGEGKKQTARIAIIK